MTADCFCSSVHFLVPKQTTTTTTTTTKKNSFPNELKCVFNLTIADSFFGEPLFSVVVVVVVWVVVWLLLQKGWGREERKREEREGGLMI